MECKYCHKELNSQGECPVPCHGGALLIKIKDLKKKIEQEKKEKSDKDNT